MGLTPFFFIGCPRFLGNFIQLELILSVRIIIVGYISHFMFSVGLVAAVVDSPIMSH